MAAMLTEFGKIFIFFILGAVFVSGGLITNWAIRPSRPTREKTMIYECGEDAEGPAHIRFNIRFYVIALAFLLFDLEFVLLFPWATVFRGLGTPAFWLGMVFITVLLVGDAYLWKKGDLDWVLPTPVKPDLGTLLTHDKPRFRPAKPTVDTPVPAETAPTT
ncbi:MAG: NADH-quinone oxidoreductase subunit A [Bacteroidota bacterium]